MQINKPTNKQKIEMYENLLHLLQLNADVVMNKENTHKLMSNIFAWSYAHRQGNGEYSEKEQNNLVYNRFWKLTNLD